MYGVAGNRPDLVEKAREAERRTARFIPVLQLILTDRDARFFRAERWCFLGSVDGWLPISEIGTIDAVAAVLVPTLGTEAFYDLF